MGNNHDQYFGKNKRKILVLGIQNSGKTTLLHACKNGQVKFSGLKSEIMEIHDIHIAGKHNIIFDLAGGRRERVFWKDNFEGTQGVIYVIDVSTDQKKSNEANLELEKVIKDIDQNVPFAICFTKIDLLNKPKISLPSKLIQLLNKRTYKLFDIEYSNSHSFKNMIEWLVKKTKQL